MPTDFENNDQQANADAERAVVFLALKAAVFIAVPAIVAIAAVLWVLA